MMVKRLHHDQLGGCMRAGKGEGQECKEAEAAGNGGSCSRATPHGGAEGSQSDDCSDEGASAFPLSYIWTLRPQRPPTGALVSQLTRKPGTYGLWSPQ